MTRCGACCCFRPAFSSTCTNGADEPDHVPVVVTGPGGERIEVPQRLVQGLVRMGFLGRVTAQAPQTSPETSHADSTIRDTLVTVTSAGWVGLGASYGSAWYRPVSSLRLR